MTIKVKGIHQVSSVSHHPQETMDFYTGFLGLRLVKNTLNYDDEQTFHFYYGNQNASNNLITLFPIVDSDEGKIGMGQVGFVTYLVKPNSLAFWEERLKAFNLPHYYVTRFNEKRLAFQDRNGLDYELVEGEATIENTWEFNGVTKDVAIQGIQSAQLYSSDVESTTQLLTEILGYELLHDEEEFAQFKINDEMGGLLEVRKKFGQIGTRGYGTVHHIALKINDEDVELWHQKITDAGYNPTEIKDRKYFKAIYFRDRGGILFELSTLKPGMTIDEDVDALGSELLIPKHYEEHKDIIEDRMMPVFVRPVDHLESYSYRNRKEFEVIQKRQEILAEINELKAKENLTQEEENKLQNLRREFIKAKEHLQ